MASSIRTKGFTLIELVSVITILGVLSATAIPKFVDMTKESRIAKLKTMEGALHSTAQLWHAACLLSSDRSCMNGWGHLTRNGTTIFMRNGYPNAGDWIGIDEIDMGLTHSGFTVVIPDAFHHTFRVTGAPIPAQCWVSYCINSPNSPASCPKGSYSISIDTTGC